MFFSVSFASVARVDNRSQEARQEDVDPASASTLTPSPTLPARPEPDGRRSRSPAAAHYEHYTAYDSPFECYPLLRGAAPKLTQASIHSYSPTTSCSISSASSSTSISSLASCSSSLSSTYYNSSVFPLPNLKPLKLATSSALDPAKRICQFEVPGGGVCRDAGCGDVHLNRVGREGGAGVVEPSDADTAEYLCKLLPGAWVQQHDASTSRIAGALAEARIKDASLVFEERVARALASLGPPLS
ncbi:hypothetical protein C8R45DRAFT_1089828 [Mycena sanguinolenta]|nr:hypothetical protein C8R45DRAFT_1089828 [Mycena sanguinolenta]